MANLWDYANLDQRKSLLINLEDENLAVVEDELTMMS